MRPFLDKLMKRTQLTLEEQGAILSLRGMREEFDNQQDFLGGEDLQTSLCLISRGVCARTSIGCNGERQITAFHMVGDIPDLHRLMLPESASTFVALCPGEIVRIRKSEIREVALKYPGIAEAMWRDTVCDGSISAEWIVNIGRRDARARLAHLFCEMAIRFGKLSGNAFSYAFPVTQGNLADATGLSAVHTNRTVQALRRDGLLKMHGKAVWIEDWDALRIAGDFTIDYLNLNAPTRLSSLSMPH
jgi:CRP-like cAMP-binding protein